jgi:allantoinase
MKYHLSNVNTQGGKNTLGRTSPMRMDHSLYNYSAWPRRGAPPVSAQARQGLFAFVVLCLEHWDAEPAPDALRDPRFVGEFGSFTPDYRSWTQREYGLRIGVFRVVEALREAGLRPAVAANSRVLERVPHLVRLLQDWGCEWIAHGTSANDLMHARMSLPRQQTHVRESVEALKRYTGRMPLGWLSQDWGSSPQTYDLLAEEGLRYTLDWNNDDQPYLMRTEPPLLSIPLSSEWDDVQCQWLRHLTPAAHARLALTAFDRLRSELLRSQGMAVFGLTLHPWVCGMASRIGGLRMLLRDLGARKDVCWLDPGDLLASTSNARTCPT